MDVKLEGKRRVTHTGRYTALDVVLPESITIGDRKYRLEPTSIKPGGAVAAYTAKYSGLNTPDNVIVKEARVGKGGYIQNEARILERLAGESFAPVLFGYGDRFLGYGNGNPYLIEEYVAGKPVSGLRERLFANKRDLSQQLDGTATADNNVDNGSLLQQLVEMTMIAHNKGVVLRDWKPGDIFITPEGRVKAVDWNGAVSEEAAREETQRAYISYIHQLGQDWVNQAIAENWYGMRRDDVMKLGDLIGCIIRKDNDMSGLDKMSFDEQMAEFRMGDEEKQVAAQKRRVAAAQRCVEGYDMIYLWDSIKKLYDMNKGVDDALQTTLKWLYGYPFGRHSQATIGKLEEYPPKNGGAVQKDGFDLSISYPYRVQDGVVQVEQKEKIIPFLPFTRTKLIPQEVYRDGEYNFHVDELRGFGASVDEETADSTDPRVGETMDVIIALQERVEEGHKRLGDVLK